MVHMYPFAGECNAFRADLLEKGAYTYLSTYNFPPCHLFKIFDKFYFLVAFLSTIENRTFGGENSFKILNTYSPIKNAI